ncbi:MAG: zinc ribbon domain-containing protein [Ahniella sp.]|nr:zinc ribbon domain-containing protein [Ahniella sp.]
MPIYEYVATDESCDHCRAGFEVLQRLSDSDIRFCPICTRPVHRRISAPAVAGGSGHPAQGKPLLETRLHAIQTRGKGPIREDSRGRTGYHLRQVTVCQPGTLGAVVFL